MRAELLITNFNKQQEREHAEMEVEHHHLVSLNPEGRRCPSDLLDQKVAVERSPKAWRRAAPPQPASPRFSLHLVTASCLLQLPSASVKWPAIL